MTEYATFETVDSIAYVTLNRPERLNAISVPVLESVHRAFGMAEASDAAAIVLRGAGRAFCSGADLKQHSEGEFTTERMHRQLELGQGLTSRIWTAVVPVIASVHGFALGAGCELALACDLVVASEDAVFGFPEVDVELVGTGGISYLLPRALSHMKAKELMFTGRRFGAEEAAALGLVNWVVPQEDLKVVVREKALLVASKSRHAIQSAKTLLNHGLEASFDAALRRESEEAVGAYLRMLTSDGNEPRSASP